MYTDVYGMIPYTLHIARYLANRVVSSARKTREYSDCKAQGVWKSFGKIIALFESFWDCKFSSRLVQYRFHPSVSGPDVTHTSGESVPSVYTRNSISLASRVQM